MKGISPNRVAFPCALAIAAALVFPAIVPGAQQISITGSVLSIKGDSSSEKVILSVDGDNLAIKGFFDGPTPQTCTVVEDRKRIHCPLASINSVSIDTAGGDDAVFVDETLPFPVSAEMGGGVDGFTGAGEDDTCIGEAGDDICQPGEGSDVCNGGDGDDHCVLGPGRDLCNLGPGADGCAAGADPDTCKGGPGPDRCKGGDGSDVLDGGRGHDVEIGGRGRDMCDPTPGNDKLKDCEVVLR